MPPVTLSARAVPSIFFTECDNRAQPRILCVQRNPGSTRRSAAREPRQNWRSGSELDLRGANSEGKHSNFRADGVTSLFFEFVKLHKLATELSRSANNIIGTASSIAVERRLGLPAMLVAIAAILLLIVSTFRYDARISDFMVYAMIVVGFLPHHCRNCDKLRGPREYKHV